LDHCHTRHGGLGLGTSIAAGTAAQRQLIHVSAGLAIWPSRSSFHVALNRSTAPQEITPFGRWADRGRIAHWLLYVLLAAVIFAGITAQFADGDALPVFGLFEIASPWAKDHQFAEGAHGTRDQAGLQGQ
jgi:cytochrome b561